VHTEVLLSKSLDSLAETRFAIVPLATQYLKPGFALYLGNVLGGHVMRIVEAPELDLTTDPLEVNIALHLG
jgi:Ras GTPase-activating-like protein IQGAP2/3